MEKARITHEGASCRTLEEFFECFGSQVLGGTPWGMNLDAFNDVLRGNFGTPEGGFLLVWKNHQMSKEFLGYSETLTQLHRILEKCHPSNRSRVLKQIDAARRGVGPTVFDWLVEIIKNHGSGGTESSDGVELLLD